MIALKDRNISMNSSRNQLNAMYGVRSLQLQPLHQIAMQLLDRGRGREFGSVAFHHIDRWENEDADQLARKAVQGKTDWSSH